MRTTSQILRDEGIKQVEDNTDSSWLDEALAAIEYLAQEQTYISADDVWPLLTSRPHHNAAMGAVFRRAGNLGIIEPTSQFVQSKRPSTHARPLRVWMVPA